MVMTSRCSMRLWEVVDGIHVEGSETLAGQALMLALVWGVLWVSRAFSKRALDVNTYCI